MVLKASPRPKRECPRLVYRDLGQSGFWKFAKVVYYVYNSHTSGKRDAPVTSLLISDDILWEYIYIYIYIYIYVTIIRLRVQDLYFMIAVEGEALINYHSWKSRVNYLLVKCKSTSRSELSRSTGLFDLVYDHTQITAFLIVVIYTKQV